MKIKGMLFILFVACVGHIGAMDAPKGLPANVKAANILKVAWPNKIRDGKKIADEFFNLIATFPKIKTQEDYLTAFENRWKRKYKEDLGFSIKDYLTIPALKNKIQIKTDRGKIYLDLDNMKINNLYGLQNIPNIKTVQSLYLGSNKLTTIQSNAFAGLPNLKELVLLANQLTTIQPKAFAGLLNLTTLYLSYNQLKAIPTNALAGLTNLTRLDLFDNKLTAQSKEAIRKALKDRDVQIDF